MLNIIRNGKSYIYQCIAMLNISPSGYKDGKIFTPERALTQIWTTLIEEKEEWINRRDEWYLECLFTCGHANCANQLILSKSL